MAAIKAYMIDSETLQERAREVVWLPTARERLVGLRELWWDAGSAAARYADPDRVARMFVQDIREAYQEATADKARFLTATEVGT